MLSPYPQAAAPMLHVTACLHDTTQDQVECAVFHLELMMRYKPSTIAFAAVLRGEDEIECPEFTDEMRERFLALQPKFELEPMEVLEARFVLARGGVLVPYHRHAGGPIVVSGEGWVTATNRWRMGVPSSHVKLRDTLAADSHRLGQGRHDTT